MFTFDTETHSGSVILDDGTALDFAPKAFLASGLRLLRPGQRVRLRLSERAEVTLVTIATLADPPLDSPRAARPDPDT